MHRTTAGLIAAMALAPALLAQGAVTPLATAGAAARIDLPDLIAVKPDTAYQVVVPALFERRAIFRQALGEWTLVERVFARDSARASRLSGLAAAFYFEGQSVGAGRVRGVIPGLCGEAPAWCPPRAAIDVVGSLMLDTIPIVAVSPPPIAIAETVEPNEDEVVAATVALLGLMRRGAGPRGRLEEEELAPQVFTIADTSGRRRIVVAAGGLEAGAAGRVNALVVGVAADTLLRQAVGRAARRPPGAYEDLRLVTAMDLNADGRHELLLGWVSGGQWSFEILAADRLGRYSVHFRGPDRSLPAPAVRTRRP